MKLIFLLVTSMLLAIVLPAYAGVKAFIGGVYTGCIVSGTGGVTDASIKESDCFAAKVVTKPKDKSEVKIPPHKDPIPPRAVTPPKESR